MSYDAFLSHNSEDKPHVVAIEGWLRRNGVNCFLDRNDLQPGDVLTDALGKAIGDSKSALIFIGPHGEGPWMSEEVDSLLNKSIKLSRTKNEFRIIPVLLPGADTTQLRWFLQTRLWIDLANGVTDNEAELFRLKAAILGERGIAIPADPDFNPYRGLEAFQIKDAPFFFGRAKECAELAQKLKDSRFCAVIGPSGNGKSSLARAGLATEPALRVLPGIGSWKRLFVKPGGDLLHSILVQLFADVTNEQRGTVVEKAMSRIIPDPANLSAENWAEGLDRELKQVFTGENDRVLLLIDQFEEIFTHRGAGTVSELDRQERIKRVLDGLACMRENGDRRWHLLLTMRSDFTQRCRLSPEFWALLEKKHLCLELEELDDVGWREAIKGPAARSGAYFEAGLVETMLKDVYRQRGSMPLLQFALQAVWQLRDGACVTHAAYQSIGGVGNALQQRADTALAKLAQDDAEQGEIARNLFVRLVTPGEGVSDTRRRVDRDEIVWENTDSAKSDHVLGMLTASDNRLIVADGRAIEITHEVLIRDTRVIRDWIEQARGEIPMLRRLTHAARRWGESDRDPDLLNPADPPRDLKRWIKRATLRLTILEREFWQRSREQRAQMLRDKRTSQRRIREEQHQRVHDAEDATRRIRKWTRVAWSFGAVMLVAAMIAAVFLRRAVLAEKDATTATALAKQASHSSMRAEAAAQDALAKSLTRTISSIRGNSPTSIEVDSLWELAELGDGMEAVRSKVLEDWIRTEGNFLPALAWEGGGARAAVGLVNHRIAKVDVPNILVGLLEDPNETDEDRLLAITKAIVTGSGELDAHAASILADRLVIKLENPLETDVHRLRALSASFAALSESMDEASVASMASRLVKAMESSNSDGGYKIVSLGGSFVSVADRLKGEEATLAAEHLVKILEDFPEADALRHSTLAESIEAVGGGLDANLEVSMAESLVGALERTKIPNKAEEAEEAEEAEVFSIDRVYVDRLLALTKSFMAISRKMEGEAAMSLSKRVADGLVKAYENPVETGDDNLLGLAESIVVIFEKLDVGLRVDLSRRIADRLMWIMDDSGDPVRHRLSAFECRIAALAKRLERGAGAMLSQRIAERLVKALEKAENGFSDYVEALVTVDWNGADATSTSQRISQRLAKALERWDANIDGLAGMNNLRELATSFAAVAEKLDVQAAASLSRGIIQHWTKALENAEDRRSLVVSAETFATMGDTLDAGEVNALSQGLAERLVKLLEDGENVKSDEDYENLLELADAMGLVAGKLSEEVAIAIAERLMMTIKRSSGAPALALSGAFGAVAEKLPGRAKALMMERLVKTLENPEETDGSRLAALMNSVAELSGGQNSDMSYLSRSITALYGRSSGSHPNIPKADVEEMVFPLSGFISDECVEFNLWSLNYMLSIDVAELKYLAVDDFEVGDSGFLDVFLAGLPLGCLVDVLKWPSCGYEEQKVVLAAIQERVGGDGRKPDFQGDVWKFVEKAPSLGIKNFRAPPRRPSLDRAMEELKEWQAKHPEAATK